MSLHVRACCVCTVRQKGHLETISIDHGSKKTTTSSLHEHKYKLYLYIHTLSYLLLYRMNWRIETEIDYFIVMKPLQAMETSQIFREIERLKQNTCAHVHWLRANHKHFIINIALVITFYRTQCRCPGKGGGVAHLIRMVQPIT